MRIRNAACAVGAAAVLGFAGTGSASAADADLDCKDFATPVIIVDGYDPDRMDEGGEPGIGCESNSGSPLVYAEYTADGSDGLVLAETGAGDLVHTHPLRTIGAVGLTIGAGAAVVIAVRRRTDHEGD